MKELLIPFRRLAGLSPWEKKTLGFLKTISDSGEVSELLGLFIRLAVVVSTVFSLVPSGNDSSFTTSCCGHGSKSERDSLCLLGSCTETADCFAGDFNHFNRDIRPCYCPTLA